MKGLRIGLAALATMLIGAAPIAKDLKNPTCPVQLNWSNYPVMKLTKVKRDGMTFLLAEGRIDDDLEARFATIFAADDKLHDDSPDKIAEIWIRSPGGNAEVGNAVGRLIRKRAGIATRIPSGWACFSACNFVFMGGKIRIVDPGGLFIVHMFTFTADGGVTASRASENYESAVDTISQVERDAAMLASDDNDFMIRMGVSRKLLTEVMYQQKAVAGTGTDRSTRRCLTDKELFKYGVANASSSP